MVAKLFTPSVRVQIVVIPMIPISAFANDVAIIIKGKS